MQRLQDLSPDDSFVLIKILLHLSDGLLTQTALGCNLWTAHFDTEIILQPSIGMLEHHKPLKAGEDQAMLGSIQCCIMPLPAKVQLHASNLNTLHHTDIQATKQPCKLYKL